MDRRTAYEALTEHKHFRYRGCAPDPDRPGRAAGNPALSVNAWLSHTDGAEEQKARIARERAAVGVCVECPVMVACMTYANTLTPDGKLAEPDGIWGGQLALERHRALIRHRAAAGPVADANVVAEARTAQKQALLGALAAEVDEELVARAARMDVRTANWHRSLLCGLFGLDKDRATREDLLHAARDAGVLPPGARIRPDGLWPIAAAPTSDGVRQRRLAPDSPQLRVVLPTSRTRRPRRAAVGRTAHNGRGLHLVRLAVQLPLFTLPLSAADTVLEPAA